MDVGVLAAFTGVVAFTGVAVVVETVNERATDVFVGRTATGDGRHEVIKEINMIPDRTTMIFPLIDMKSPLVQLRMRA